MINSAALLSLWSEVFFRLTTGPHSTVNPAVIIDLAPILSPDLVPDLFAAVRVLPLPPRDKAETLAALVACLPVSEGEALLESACQADPALTPFVDQDGSLLALAQAAHEGEGSPTDSVTSTVESDSYRASLLHALAPFLARHKLALPTQQAATRHALPSRSLRWRVSQLASPAEQRLLLDAVLETVSAAASVPWQSPPQESACAGDGPDEPTEPPLATSRAPSRAPSTRATRALSLDSSADDAPFDAATPTEPEPSPAVISTGFAAQQTPDQPLSPQTALLRGGHYYFWLQLGEQVAQSIELQTVSIPKEYAHAGATLKVVLFAFPGGLILDDSACMGELRLSERGGAVVQWQPASLQLASLTAQRLFFPVSVPEHVALGTSLRLRCNIYCNHVLLQSRIVTVDVDQQPRDADSPPALRSLLDYSICDAVGQSAQLQRVVPHKLSVLLNDNDDGTHSFRFFGSDGKRDVRKEASLDEDTLHSHIRHARGALRRAAWGDEDPWKGSSGGQSYRYAEQPRAKLLSQLYSDLIPLAVSGSRFYVGIIRGLAGSVEASWDLQALMREPGLVQIASKVTARHMVPAALLYDQPLDDGQPASAYKICPAFRAAMDSARPLEETDCLLGRCPSYDSDTTICPSGFWGYRHLLGMPLTGPSRTDPQPTILYENSPHLSACVSLDLREFAIHEKALKALRKDLIWQCADSAPETFEVMREGHSHIVYFYCHGGTVRDMPYLEVGKGEAITPASLFRKRIRWTDPRPLVFLNGCHTVALDPEQVMDLVTEFVEVAQATGVIGTEITIFEPLARAFAEECLGRFLSGQPIGQAVRGARLGLLKAGNPLGLAYNPFVLASVTLAPRPPQ